MSAMAAVSAKCPSAKNRKAMPRPARARPRRHPAKMGHAARNPRSKRALCRRAAPARAGCGAPVMTLLERLLNLRRGEPVPVLFAALFFFCVLTALMLLRPAREALGMQRGIEAVRWLFIGTAAVTLLVNPAFGWLVSRYRRLQFIGATYAFFAASLLVFYLILVLAPRAV